MEIMIWIFLAVIFFILELITTSFFLVWLGVGSVASALLNYLGFNTYIQFGGFVIVSVVLLFLTKRFADKITPKSDKKTNYERLIGKKAIVFKKINKTEAILKVSGEKWSDYTTDDEFD